MRPVPVRRAGPVRAVASAPFWPSMASLKKFVAIWMQRAARRVQSQRLRWKSPLSFQARTPPSHTGTRPAASVLGRVPEMMAGRSCIERLGDSREFREIGLTFFDERFFAFFAFLGHVVKQGCIAGEVQEAHLAIAICVECGFQAAQCEGGVGKHFPAPFDCFGFEICEGDDSVDEAHFEGLVGVVLAAEVPDFPGFFLADDAGEVTGAEAAIEAADLGAGLAEARVVCGDGEIANDVEDMAAADGVACDHGDDGFGQGADFFLEIEHVEAGNAVAADVAGVATDFLIAPGAECEIARAGENDYAYVGVFMCEIKGAQHFGNSLWAEGVAHFGAIDRDFGDGAVFRGFIEDVLECFFADPHVARTWLASG